MYQNNHKTFPPKMFVLEFRQNGSLFSEKIFALKVAKICQKIGLKNDRSKIVKFRPENRLKNVLEKKFKTIALNCYIPPENLSPKCFGTISKIFFLMKRLRFLEKLVSKTISFSAKL
jgi:hypothetical protein